MGFKRNIAAIVASAGSLIVAAPAFAASTGSGRSDHDLYLVPPSQTATVQFASPYTAQDPVDQAMQDFGRAISQAAQADQQRIQDRCRVGAPLSATAQDRYAWAASCRYARR